MMVMVSHHTYNRFSTVMATSFVRRRAPLDDDDYIMCVSENVAQIKNGVEWTFYASCPSGFGEETKNTERRPRERLLKESCEPQPLTQITNVMIYAALGMVQKRARQI